MYVMKVTGRVNNMVFRVVHEQQEHRALQMADRQGGGIYANTEIRAGDLVLVAKVPTLLLAPSQTDVGESINHLIVGLLPPSQARDIPNYHDLVSDE